MPIVSFKELPRSDWKRLPDLVTSGFHGRANVVVCTHLDQVSRDNVEELLKTVTKAFWPRDIMNTNSVIPCSSLMGLSARDLLDKSHCNKPPFEEIWKKDTVGYYVRQSLLTKAGAEQPPVRCQNSRGWRPRSCLCSVQFKHMEEQTQHGTPR